MSAPSGCAVAARELTKEYRLYSGPGARVADKGTSTSALCYNEDMYLALGIAGLLVGPTGIVACAEHARARPDIAWGPLVVWRERALTRFAGAAIGCEDCQLERDRNKPKRRLWARPADAPRKRR